MLSFPRRRRGKDNRQLYLVPDITSFILVYHRDNQINNYTLHIPAKDGDTILKGSAALFYFIVKTTLTNNSHNTLDK